MKTKIFAALAAATLMTLTGCGSIDRNTAGTVGGAVAGGALGSAIGGGTLGTLGGAAVGGYLGHEATKK